MTTVVVGAPQSWGPSACPHATSARCLRCGSDVWIDPPNRSLVLAGADVLCAPCWDPPLARVVLARRRAAELARAAALS